MIEIEHGKVPFIFVDIVEGLSREYDCAITVSALSCATIAVSGTHHHHVTGLSVVSVPFKNFYVACVIGHTHVFLSV